MSVTKPRILLVEDEADTLFGVKKHLEGQGYEVTCAPTLGEARRSFRARPPDLVLLDVMMPDGSGYEFCEEVRKTSSIPVIYLTCLDGNEDVVRGLSDGGDDYITKPFDQNVLSARVVAQLRRANLSGAGRIELPPLVVDLLKGRATLKGETVDLSQKELQLLAFFASHPGRIFSSDELYEAVWSGVPEKTGDMVKTRISSLRKKLRFDREGSPFEIRSSKGKGYTFTRLVDEPEE
jgi:DNA-binding response OmpR family regulator